MRALSVYGIGKHLGLQEWRDIARALLHQGLMTQSQDGYAVLSLNEASWQVLRGERAVQVGESVKPARGRKASKPTTANAGDPLFESLRALRKRLANEAGMPPYIIFNDASLWDMAQRQPTTLQEFSTILGVGQAKLARYGGQFVELIRQQAQASLIAQGLASADSRASDLPDVARFKPLTRRTFLWPVVLVQSLVRLNSYTFLR